MKYLITLFLVSLFMLSAASTQAERVIYLLDDEYEAYMNQLENDEFEDDDKIPAIQPVDISAAINEPQPKKDLSKKHERLDERTRQAQARLLVILKRFTEVEFVSGDPESGTEFVEITHEIVKNVFFAETERAFYERLYIINQFWLENPDQIERFNYLDEQMRDKWLSIEARRKQIQEMMVGGASFLGMIGGGYLSYKVSTKIFPVAANEATFRILLKWLGRGTFIAAGAYVGASVGAYAGFLGSEFLFRNHIFVDPIDGQEDLREILDVLDDL